MTKYFKKQVDDYLDNMISKQGKGQGGQKIKAKEDTGEDLTQMIADLKK